MPPLTLRATRTPVSSSVTTKMSVGTVATEPSTPRPTGGEPVPVDGHEPGIHEADEGDEQADADRDRQLELDRDGVEDHAAAARSPRAGR